MDDDLRLLIAILVAYMLSIGFCVVAILFSVNSLIKVILDYKVATFEIEQRYILRSTSMSDGRETN